MGQKILAGFLAGLLLAGVFVLYYLVRGKAFIATMKSSSPEMANMSDTALFYMFLGAFIFAAMILGILSGVVYRFVGVPANFRLLALGLALLASILAAVSRTPMPVDKVFMNCSVAGVLGGLVPILA